MERRTEVVGIMAVCGSGHRPCSIAMKALSHPVYIPGRPTANYSSLTADYLQLTSDTRKTFLMTPTESFWADHTRQFHGLQREGVCAIGTKGNTLMPGLVPELRTIYRNKSLTKQIEL